jgi:MOSC domain-containing protein YiiM
MVASVHRAVESAGYRGEATMSIDHRAAIRLGTVTSVNVGEPRQVEWAGRSVRTAIWKTATEGRVLVAHDNLMGDAQADLRVHGGPDKAVYAYASEDYRWWEEQLGTALDVGTFGENLTTEGIDLADAVIGEVWGVGTAKLEVAQTRQPCFKLGIRMGDAGFVQEFDRARRYGIYLRIHEVGEIGAGDEVFLLSRPTHGMTASVFADTLDSDDPVAIRRLVDIDEVPEGIRIWAVRQLQRADRDGS